MSGVYPSVRGLVEQLESLADALPDDPPLEELVEYVEHRREAATALARLDLADMSAPEKRGLAARVRKILERDQALVFALFALREDVASRISSLPAARRTARGYGAGPRGGRLLRKTA